MTDGEVTGLLMLLVLGYLLYRWNRWSNRYLKRNGIANPVSRNTRHERKPKPEPAKSGRVRKAHEQDRPYAECFDDNDPEFEREFEMEDDL